ncbi:predicted protein [Postia placenta Mad-698-R]|nr:predicted protein [Postia placenta Mad-698-R]
MYNQGLMLRLSEHTSMCSLDLIVNSELLLDPISEDTLVEVLPAEADIAKRFPQIDLQSSGVKIISDGIIGLPFWQEPNVSFFPSAVGCPIAASWPHLRQGPAMSALPSEITEDTTRGTTQDATYSEASLQNRFLTLVSGLSLAGMFGISEPTKEDEHDTLPTLLHAERIPSGASGTASRPARRRKPAHRRRFKSAHPFARLALPVELWDMVLDCLVGAESKELLKLSLVCRHWWTMCRPYLVRNIVSNNRGDVLREYRTRRRDWAAQRCVTIRGAENTRSLGHFGFVAALFGPTWQSSMGTGGRATSVRTSFTTCMP